MFMISGSQLLNPEKDFSFKKLFMSNILRLITAFLFWSFLYATYNYVYRYGTLSPEAIKSFIRAFVLGHYHLWFLYTLVGLYLIVPILRKIAEHKELMAYFIALSFVFTFLVNVVVLMTGEQTLISVVLSQVNFNFALGYAGYFVLGSYLFRFELSKRLRWLMYGLGIGSVLVTMVATSLLSTRQNMPIEAWYGYLLPTTLLSSVAIFLFFQSHVKSIQLTPNTQRHIVHVSKLSFGMYLVHDFVNIGLREVFNLTSLSFNPILSVPVLSALVFGISYAVATGLSKIPFVNRYFL
jgi:surface polysaccharide O-acyltransferase-like enzyme